MVQTSLVESRDYLFDDASRERLLALEASTGILSFSPSRHYNQAHLRTFTAQMSGVSPPSYLFFVHDR